MGKIMVISTEFEIEDNKDIDHHDLANLISGACDNIPQDEMPDGVSIGISYPAGF